MKPRSHRKNRVLLLLLSLLGALVFADVGDEGRTTSAPAVQREVQEISFPIVAIRVSGNRLAGDQLIIKESGLKTSRAYSEKQLQLALRRVQRLPFVLSAEISLERGDSYGTFAVRFAVEENKALFFHYDRLEISRPDPPPLVSPEDLASSTLAEGDLATAVVEEDDLNRLNLGARWFIGRFAFVYGSTALSSEEGSFDLARGKPVDVGFSHYNLFGSGLFLNLNVQFSQTADFENFDPWTRGQVQVRLDRDPTVSVNAALPLGGRHFLTFSGNYLDEQQVHLGENLFVDRIDLQRLVLEAGWLSEAVNDAVFPSRGRRFLVNLSYIDEDRDFDFVATSEDTREGESDDFTEDSFFDTAFGPSGLNSVSGLFLRGAWDNYQPLSRQGFTAYQRVSLLAQLDRQGSQFEVPLNFGGAATLGLSYDLWGRGKARRFGDLRLEGEATYVHTDLDEDETFLVLEDHYHRLQASLAFRNAWGLIRLGAAYRSDALPVVAQMP
ncbi:hypothetical protein [Acanthopleuribacter pedis]|uniref:POTRA domain-containing protein n=1 Tax=Acanthopleuribacter pedis TaxID=442870 RepID=A0A8J7U5G8_9BACT|nr:hypothetical protein [Acanthopleuribacter pedis]MBO1320428.1 hypothetical protein [Acanthopleuribacter pedis]